MIKFEMVDVIAMLHLSPSP